MAEEEESIHKHYFNFSYASLSKNSIVKPQVVQVQQNERVRKTWKFCEILLIHLEKNDLSSNGM